MWETIRSALLDRLHGEEEGVARWHGLAAYEQDLCLAWMAADPAAVPPTRLERLATRLCSFMHLQPMYGLGELTFDELWDRYGPPYLLEALSLPDQTQALAEARVLAVGYERNYDDSRVLFWLASSHRSALSGPFCAGVCAALRADPSDGGLAVL